MTPEAYRGFVEKYTERYKQAHRDRKTVGEPEIRERAMEMVGSIERQQGQQADLDADAGRARKGSETDVDLRESARERIAPEYTERLDAVLRELGTGEATSEK